MKKLVEIIKDQTVERIKATDPKLAGKLTTLERKMNVVADSDRIPSVCIELAFFAVFEMFLDELVIEKTQDEKDFVCYSVTFTHGTIDDIELFINFSKD